jgi:hypothetical protein
MNLVFPKHLVSEKTLCSALGRVFIAIGAVPRPGDPPHPNQPPPSLFPRNLRTILELTRLRSYLAENRYFEVRKKRELVMRTDENAQANW